MGAVLISLGGGGGVSSDELTATSAHVLEGEKYVGADTNDEIGTGTMPNNGAISQALNCGGSYTIPKGYHDGNGKVTANSLASQTDGDASASHILKDKVAYVDGARVVGTMANNGAVAPSALGAGGSYTIPAGYHNGSGKVTVQSLATLTASGDATAAQILSGKKAYVDGNLITGSMTDQGAKTSSLNCGGSYTIPAGYHNGSGKITANSLSSQTSATATAAQILKDKTAWVNGSKLTGTLAVTSAINFKATAQSASVIRISWTNPSKGPWEGVFIQMSTSGNPGVSGGTRKYTGKGNNATAGGSNYVDISGLSYGTTYYFTCTSYASGLGNGSSYNVNAKTKDLVLWDGSSLQNGAYWDPKRGTVRLWYDFSVGSITSRNLIVKLKNDKENSHFTFVTTNSADDVRWSTATTSTVYNTIADVYCWWGANTEYAIPLSKLTGISDANHFQVMLETTEGYYGLDSVMSYIAIR